jgi:hypothetical protein
VAYAPIPESAASRARVNYPQMAKNVASQLTSDDYWVRLAGVTTALRAGGVSVTSGNQIVAKATTPVGKLRATVLERANIALSPAEPGITAAQLAASLRAGKILTRPGAPITVLAKAFRTWVTSARAKPHVVTSFAPLLLREGVLQRSGVDLAAAKADLSAVSLTSLEVFLLVASLDRAVPLSMRKPVTKTPSSAPLSAMEPRDDDPAKPNPQACGDWLRRWLREGTLPAEQVAMGVAGKLAGDLTGKFLGDLGKELTVLLTSENKLLKDPDVVIRVGQLVGRALAVFNTVIKVQKAVTLFRSVEVYVDTPIEVFEAPIEIPGIDNSGFVPFVAVVGLPPEAQKAYDQASTDSGTQNLLNQRKWIMDCADVFGVQLPLTSKIDAGDDLENFRVDWELQVEKRVQWDIQRWFNGKSYPAKTAWFVTPPRAVGKLTKIDNGQAAHVMYARIPAQPDHRLRAALYERRTTQAVVRANIDFSQPPNVKTLTDAALAGVDPFGLLGTLTDLALGMTQQLVMPNATAAVEIQYYAPKCAGAARAAWRKLRADVCEGRTLSVGVTGEGLVTSNPDGLACTGVCDGEFLAGEVVSLTATPADGYRFVSWQGPAVSLGDCQPDVPACPVPMDQDTSIEAVFERIPSNQVKVNVVGNGVVRGNVTDISCGVDQTLCERSDLALGAPLVLTATAETGWEFVGWTATGCSGIGTCTLVISEELQEVTATFIEKQIECWNRQVSSISGTVSLSSSSSVDDPIDQSRGWTSASGTLTGTWPIYDTSQASTFSGSSSLGLQFFLDAIPGWRSAESTVRQGSSSFTERDSVAQAQVTGDGCTVSAELAIGALAHSTWTVYSADGGISRRDEDETVQPVGTVRLTNVPVDSGIAAGSSTGSMSVRGSYSDYAVGLYATSPTIGQRSETESGTPTSSITVTWSFTVTYLDETSVATSIGRQDIERARDVGLAKASALLDASV